MNNRAGREMEETMRHYRQHPIVLIGAVVEALLLMGLGIGLANLFGWLPFLGLIPLALVTGAWRVLQWATFTVRIEGRQVILRSLRRFVISEQVVSLNAPGGLRLRQNISGFFLDYGMLRIDVFNSPVQIRYIAPFSSLRQQVEGR